MTNFTRRLMEVKNRLAKATPGPWRSVQQHPISKDIYYIHPDDGSVWLSPLEMATFYKSGNPQAEYDASLTAHAPSDLAVLVQALEKSLETLEYIKSVRNRKCQDKGCTCAYDTAEQAVLAIDKLFAEGSGE